MMNDVQQGLDDYASALLTVSGRPLRVHAFRCGMISIKRWHHRGVLPEATPSAIRFAAILADPVFVKPMPVWAFVIEHPDGLVVIDTGADPTYADPSTWVGHQPSRRLIHSFIKLRAADADALPNRMLALGLEPAEVRAVVLTHQHIDHTGTVSAFADAEVWTTQAEDRAARSIGAEQWRWRSEATRVRHVDVLGSPGDLGAEVDLLGDGSLLAAHTPGHTPGSVTVSLAADRSDVLFTGDTSFTEAGMDPNAPTAGIHTDVRAVRRLQSSLRSMGCLLPSHDPDVPSRLRALNEVGAA